MRKFIFKDTDWPLECALIINNHITDLFSYKGCVNIFLTGGRGAKKVYKHLSFLLSSHIGDMNFFLGDERFLPESHIDSNYRMIHECLFPNGLMKNQKLYKMFDSLYDVNTAALKYEEIIPENIDMLLLGLGDDGHIASLFPGSMENFFQNRSVISVNAPNGIKRLTITKKIIDNSDEIIIFATGVSKKNILSQMKIDSDINVIPASLVYHGLWLIDESACN